MDFYERIGGLGRISRFLAAFVFLTWGIAGFWTPIVNLRPLGVGIVLLFWACFWGPSESEKNGYKF